MHKDFLVRFGEDPSDYKPSIRVGRLNRPQGLHPLLFVASALDPRFKSLSILPEETKEKIFKILFEFVSRAAKDQLALRIADQKRRDAEVITAREPERKRRRFSDENERERRIMQNLLAPLMDDNIARENEQPINFDGTVVDVDTQAKNQANIELALYNSKAPIGMDCDPLKFWSVSEDAMPTRY